LEKIRDLREAEVKRVKEVQVAVQATQSELAQAEINLLEATVKVSQRKEAVASAVSADLLPKLASEQAMLGIDLEAIKIGLDRLDGHIAELERPALEAARKLEAAKKRLDAERCWAIIASPEPKVQDK
jgi:predicted  nucleic acid-binding Zn-ribbon protein